MKPGLGFSHRQNRQFLQIVGAALGVRVKAAHGIQLIAKEFGANGTVGGGGVDVQYSAPDGKLTGAFHHAAPAIAGSGQPFQQIVQRIFPANLQTESGVQQNVLRHGALAQGFPRENLQRCPAAGQIVKLAQPLLFPGAGDDRGVVKRQFPAGKHGRPLSQETVQLLLQALGTHVVLTDHHNGYIQMAAQSGNQMAPVDLADACDGSALSGRQGIEQRGVFGNCFQNGQQFFHSSPLCGSRRTRQRGKGTFSPLSVIF